MFPHTSLIVIWNKWEKLLNEDVWFNVNAIANLFNVGRPAITKHINNIYEEKELSEVNTMRKFGISEFSTKPTNFYTLN